MYRGFTILHIKFEKDKDMRTDEEISVLGKKLFAEVRAEFPDETDHRPFGARWWRWAIHTTAIYLFVGYLAYATASAVDTTHSVETALSSVLARINEVIR